MPRGREIVRDTWWKEVEFANRYALFMGYLSMAVRGLGFLVLTWTTVVLLGGFVSSLQKKDFWCLTLITLVQTAGLLTWRYNRIFDVFLTEKLRNVWVSPLGAFSLLCAVVRVQHKWRKLLSLPVGLVQIMVFGIVLCPLVAVYMFGLLISAGIALWRLRQHDYGSNSDAAAANLKPALDVLYSLALLQGVIFCFRTICAFGKQSIVSAVIEKREFDEKTEFNYEVHSLVSDYLREMMIGCEKDPSFAKGKNLITYAVELMVSKSPDDYLSGLSILDSFARQLDKIVWEREENSVYPDWHTLERLMGEHVLMKHLIVSASSSEVLQKLLQTLGLRSIYDRQAREHAMRIVANIAGDIRLEKFPGGIQYISSLIGTLEEYCRIDQPYHRDWLLETFEQDWYKVAPYVEPPQYGDIPNWYAGELPNFYKEVVLQGLRILQKLATDNNNCRVMLDTPSLLSKIMAPVTSDLLHHIDHGAWSSIVEGSLKVMSQLTAATGQIGTKLRSEISSSKEAISTMERIIKCDECNEKLLKQVIWILTNIYEDTSSIVNTASREKFIKILVDILTDDNKDKETRRVAAAKALVALSSKIETSATIIMEANDNVVDNLTTMLVEKDICGLGAVQILEHLCTHYTNDDANLKKLKKAMTYAVPKVLAEILHREPEETHTGEVNQARVMRPETDIENQCGDSQHNGQGNKSSSSPQMDYTVSEYGMICKLSLCVTVCDTLISADQDLTHQFDAITPRDGAFSFPRKLREIVEKYMRPRTGCLRILKLTCKMVISMMKHRGNYVKEDLKSLMDALSSASKDMFLLDGFMVYDNSQDGKMTPKPFRSLVEEAQLLVDKYNAQEHVVVDSVS